MNNLIKIGGVTLAGVVIFIIAKKTSTAVKAVPKFSQRPRNFRRESGNIVFELPFTITNSDSVSYTIDNIGGDLKSIQKGVSLDFCTFFSEKPMKVNKQSVNTFTVKCVGNFLDVMGFLRNFKLKNQINLEAVGKIRYLGFNQSFEEKVSITAISDILTIQ